MTQIVTVAHAETAEGSAKSARRTRPSSVRGISCGFVDRSSAKIAFMKVSRAAIALTPVTSADQDFLLRLYQSSRGDDLRELGWSEDRIDQFLAMQHEAQRNFLAADYPNIVDQIVSLDGQPAGRLAVERR